MLRMFYFIIGLTLFIAACAFSQVTSAMEAGNSILPAIAGGLAAFLNLESFFMVVLGSLFFACGAYDADAVLAALGAGIARQTSSQALAQQHARVLEGIRKICFSAGWTGFFVGFVLMAGQWGDPAKIGPGMAVAILSLMYGYALSGLILPPMINGLLAHGAPLEAMASSQSTD